MSSQPHGGGVMRAWVVYVAYEDLGSQVLGVRTDVKVGKRLAGAHWSHVCGETDAVATELKWSEYEDNEGRGWQSIKPHLTYYLEEVEFEILPTGDARETTVSYLDLQVLRLTIENGRLAHMMTEQIGVVKALEEREKQLESRIDHLIEKWVKNPQDPDAATTGYTFPDGELWKVGKHE